MRDSELAYAIAHFLSLPDDDPTVQVLCCINAATTATEARQGYDPFTTLKFAVEQWGWDVLRQASRVRCSCMKCKTEQPPINTPPTSVTPTNMPFPVNKPIPPDSGPVCDVPTGGKKEHP
jgi:hypothetical protein